MIVCVFIRFIETNFVKSDPYGFEGKHNENYNLYEVGLSDPNTIRPREFKHQYGNIPLDFSQNTVDRLAALTQTSGKINKYLIIQFKRI